MLLKQNFREILLLIFKPKVTSDFTYYYYHIMIVKDPIVEAPDLHHGKRPV